jgi:hypothetical protein
MIRKLQTNRIMLNRLEKCYGVFRFTGGVVPEEPWGLVAVTSYLQCPFAADRISTASTERYRRLAETIMDLGQAITAGERPRTLRSRHDIADRFGRYSSEIRDAANTLESATTKLAEEIKPSPLPSETEAVESGVSTNGVFTTTRGDDQ